ncbi:MAG: ABC transporter substrate-binding protein [Rhodospirillales bacterium]|nr:ABC transporter substrate-binding protein [Rhodospirillales bacterium]
MRMRSILGPVLLLLLSMPAAATRGAAAAGESKVTVGIGITVLGSPQLPADFPYFPYVNPHAPKGGTVTLAEIGSYDSFNPFILRGTAAWGLVGPWVALPGGNGGGGGIGHVWESLLAPSDDEIATGYCHICTTVEMPADRSWVAFTLNHHARFSDGHRLTAQDVAWTFRTLRRYGRPGYRIQLSAVKDVAVDGPWRVVFHLRRNASHALPLILGELPVLPEFWFKGRDFSQPLRVPPIGSGPYRIESDKLGRSVTFVRDPNWWARDLPTSIGTNNFNTVRIEYYREAAVALEAFKAGEVDLRAENISKTWATGYDFPAVRKGLVIKATIRHHLPTGMQGWVMNTRRAVFANPLTREAMAEAYDFQWANRNLFYNQYSRTLSYFSNSDLAATGVPGPAERKLLDPFRAELPKALFTEPFTLPVTDGRGDNLPELKRALALLEKAGWRVHDLKLVDKQGKQMRFTILLPDPSYERIALPYAATLKHLGIHVDVRVVDPAQYEHLTDHFDFDMTILVYAEGDIPGSEIADYWSCAAAKSVGSMNLPGVCDPAVQALIHDVITAPDRAALRTAARALDRVLLWRWYLVPHWDSRVFHIAWWNRFGHPQVPIRDGFDFDRWWVDPALAARTDAARRAGR